jgi:hypothetical protein
MLPAPPGLATARHLGGRAEPIGEDFQGSSQEIRAGAEFVEALQDQRRGGSPRTSAMEK